MTHDKCNSVWSSAWSCGLSADNLSINSGGYFHQYSQKCRIRIPVKSFCSDLCCASSYSRYTVAHNSEWGKPFSSTCLEKENGIRKMIFSKCYPKMKCLIVTLGLDHTVCDYIAPCHLVPSKTTLTVAIASQTKDVICMWRLWMDEHEMRWVYASRGSVLTWQREAQLNV